MAAGHFDTHGTGIHTRHYCAPFGQRLTDKTATATNVENAQPFQTIW